MKITKSQLENLIKEAVAKQGGNEKIQQRIVENVNRRLNESFDGVYSVVMWDDSKPDQDNEKILDKVRKDELFNFIKEIQNQGFKQDFKYSGNVFSKKSLHYWILKNPS